MGNLREELCGGPDMLEDMRHDYQTPMLLRKVDILIQLGLDLDVVQRSAGDRELRVWFET